MHITRVWDRAIGNATDIIQLYIFALCMHVAANFPNYFDIKSIVARFPYIEIRHARSATYRLHKTNRKCRKLSFASPCGCVCVCVFGICAEAEHSKQRILIDVLACQTVQH